MIASRVGGVPETVVDGDTGLLVAPGSEAELVCAMRKLVQDPELGIKLGDRGYRRACEHFSNTLVAKKIEAAYDRVLLGRSRS